MSDSEPASPRIQKTTSKPDLVIKCGAPVLQTTFKKIKLIATCLTLLLIADICFSLRLFVSAVHIRRNIGYFINMITNRDGDVIPSLQAVPVLFFLLLNVAMFFFIYIVFDKIPRRLINHLMFVVVFLSFILLIVLFSVMIAVLVHVYGEHQALHDGITTAMNNYSTNLEYKMNMDLLQIEFQCCGSKTYDEWYAIKWCDSSLSQSSSR